MKSHKLLLSALALGALAMTGCRDDYSDINQNPADIVKPSASYLFANAVNQFDPQAYLEYYYNAPMVYAWSGMGIPSGGASETILTLTATGDQGGQYMKTLRVLRDMEAYMSKLGDDEAGKAEFKVWSPYFQATNVLSIYLGIFDTDMYGDIPWNEAGRLAYGGKLTPEYDSLADLYNQWLIELDEAVAVFSDKSNYMASAQDVVYGGDLTKWAKLANSLKLRLAVRMLAVDAGKAKSIASAVESAACGYIADVDDDMLFNKGTSGSGMDDYIYHWNNGFTGTSARKAVVDLMLNNVDPRVRFFYKKNQWNSKIVQGYFDAGLEIPDFIAENVNFTTDASGKKHFESWGGLGEPWVRYYGLTEDWNAGVNVSEKYKWYFPGGYGKASTEVTLYDKDGKNPATYTATSSLNQMMIIGRSYSSASQVEASTLPDDTYTFSTESRPWYGMYIGAGEVNLYLAEFAMLNGDEGKAEGYYKKGLEASVKEFDKLAKLNKVAYYSTESGCFGYDPNEGAIDLKDGEIAAMLAGPEYAFTGTAAEKLEKIYIQEMLHFTLYPNEVYVTARRSGYPSYNSSILPRMQYAEVPANAIPRRFPTGTATATDVMTPNKKAAWSAQGLTESADGQYNAVLASERLWMDKGAPAWGAGQ